jgi:hypothetical protein
MAFNLDFKQNNKCSSCSVIKYPNVSATTDTVCNGYFVGVASLFSSHAVTSLCQ